jgi:hypothetical protein
VNLFLGSHLKHPSTKETKSSSSQKFNASNILLVPGFLFLPLAPIIVFGLLLLSKKYFLLGDDYIKYVGGVSITSIILLI